METKGLMTASTEFTISEIADKIKQIKMTVVVKDRTLDTVATVHLIWTIQ